MREISLRYSNEYDEIKDPGGVKGRATRRQRDTYVVAYNAKRNAANITAVRGNFKAAVVCGYQGGYWRFWGCDVQARKIAQITEKRFRISDRRRRK
jgi:hypothetical protein